MELIGKKIKFIYPEEFVGLPDYTNHNGQIGTVERQLGPDEADLCNERMFKVVFPDGWRGDIWETEMEVQSDISTDDPINNNTWTFDLDMIRSAARQFKIGDEVTVTQIKANHLFSDAYVISGETDSAWMATLNGKERVFAKAEYKFELIKR